MERIEHVLGIKGSDVVTVRSTSAVLAAVRQMHGHHVGSVLVEEAGALVGILTERDVVSRVVVPDRDAALTVVRDVMTPDLVVIDPQVTVADAMVMMTASRCRHLPVVDHGRLCGLVSVGDLTAWLVREQQLVIDHLHDYIIH
ncbi:MAG: CBS domain-containing protein [Myxococcales bacterium]|nr:CBS domain-containing protein [Myxococcales bacterium]